MYHHLAVEAHRQVKEYSYETREITLVDKLGEEKTFVLPETELGEKIEDAIGDEKQANMIVTVLATVGKERIFAVRGTK